MATFLDKHHTELRVPRFLSPFPVKEIVTRTVAKDSLSAL